MRCSVVWTLKFSPARQYSSHNPRGKSPMVLGLVMLGAVLGNCLFQSTCLESVHLKTVGQCFQNVGVVHPTWTVHYKAIVALCSVLTCPGTCKWFVMVSSWKKKRSNDTTFHHVTLLQLRLFMIPFKWNIASSEKHRVQENLIAVNLHFFTKFLSTAMVGWFDVLSQLEFVRI
jgi:hypothetical protein